ncbi:unnamed protein product [Durusdinium trenchii]|uniref:Uncharacterized protein n=1 Tax=Durusdinium trenchii TaxID=1381693 RepID=A0ABP0NVG8_9DINO
MGCCSSRGAAQHDEIVCTGQMRQKESMVISHTGKTTEFKRSVTFQEAETIQLEIPRMVGSMRSTRSLAQDSSDEGLQMKVFLQALQHAPHVLEQRVANKRRRDFGSA